MALPSEKLINDSSIHFQCASTDEAFDIAMNFLGFSRLILKLDRKRKAKKAGRK